MFYSSKDITKEKFHGFEPKLFDILSRYYPLELNYVDEDYLKSGSYKRLLEKQRKHIINETNYKFEWRRGFCQDLQKFIKRKVTPKTLGGMSPSRNCSIQLSYSKKKKSSVSMEIYFSLIDYLYTVEVVQWGIIEENRMPRLFPSKVWVSPTEPYLGIWQHIMAFIALNYSRYSFLPFKYEMYTVRNLMFPHSLNEHNSIHTGFFLKTPRYESTTQIIGDINYKG